MTHNQQAMTNYATSRGYTSTPTLNGINIDMPYDDAQHEIFTIYDMRDLREVLGY
jgi:hypothetical protein